MAGLLSGIMAFPGHTHLPFEEKLSKYFINVSNSLFFFSISYANYLIQLSLS